MNQGFAPIPNYDPNFDYTPIGMWGYFGYNLLFNIPIIGFIMLLIFSFGGTRNINLRNFARSWFCIILISIVQDVHIFFYLTIIYMTIVIMYTSMP